MAQKFHFTILRIEATRASRGLSAIAKLLVWLSNVSKTFGGRALSDLRLSRRFGQAGPHKFMGPAF